LEEVKFLVDTIKIVEENDICYVFDKSPKIEISQWVLEKINYVDFLGIKNYVKFSLKKNLMLVLALGRKI
jgi:hypothetical protein